MMGFNAVIKVEFQPYTMAQYLSQHQTDDVVDNIVDVEWCILLDRFSWLARAAAGSRR